MGWPAAGDFMKKKFGSEIAKRQDINITLSFSLLLSVTSLFFL
jgi:hypothetical protein